MNDEQSLIRKFLSAKDRMHIFKNMNDADILSIVHNVRLIKFHPGELITEEGLRGDDVYYILQGEYNIVANRKIIGSFGSNTLIGEIASITKTKRTASVRASKEVSVFAFTIKYSNEPKAPVSFCKFYKNIAFELISKLEKANGKK